MENGAEQRICFLFSFEGIKRLNTKIPINAIVQINTENILKVYGCMKEKTSIQLFRWEKLFNAPKLANMNA